MTPVTETQIRRLMYVKDYRESLLREQAQLENSILTDFPEGVTLVSYRDSSYRISIDNGNVSIQEKETS
jgi:hypothetical protein